MKIILNLVCGVILFTSAGCSQQSTSAADYVQTPRLHAGGSCEGCEAIYKSKITFAKMDWIDTLADYNEAGPKLIVSGVIYKNDGKTPAKDVVLYIYHTDQTGHYTNKFNESGWAGRNGYCKGWIKTNAQGQYKFYTLQPGHYPNTTVPAHIHAILKEPGINEYYIDEYLFKGDKFLTEETMDKNENRCGNGIVTLKKENGILYAQRNVVLGLNIPNYPSKKSTTQSGIDLGESCPAFDPKHLSGADAGTHACPMCKYGLGQGIMLWTNSSDFNPLTNFAKKLDDKIKVMGEKKLRVFIVFTNPQKQSAYTIEKDLNNWLTPLHLEKVAVVYLPSVNDVKSNAAAYHVNPNVTNTLFVYQKRKVIDKYINPELSDKTLNDIMQKLEKM